MTSIRKARPIGVVAILMALTGTGGLLGTATPAWAGKAGVRQSGGAHLALRRQHGLVKRVQQRLSQKGYQPGPIDGRYGPRTRRALQAYQREHQLAGDGELTQETVRQLGVAAP